MDRCADGTSVFHHGNRQHYVASANKHWDRPALLHLLRPCAQVVLYLPFESLGIAMATYTGQNYGAGKPERIWLGIKASGLMMIVYAAFSFLILMLASRELTLIFVDPSETEIINDAVQFLHISCSFFPILGVLCILRYTIQGAGFTNLAMLSGRIRDDCPYAGQYLCGTCFWIYGRLLR